MSKNPDTTLLKQSHKRRAKKRVITIWNEHISRTLTNVILLIDQAFETEEYTYDEQQCTYVTNVLTNP